MSNAVAFTSGRSVSQRFAIIMLRCRLTHILSSDLDATFFQAVVDVFLLIALVVPQSSDEVV